MLEQHPIECTPVPLSSVAKILDPVDVYVLLGKTLGMSDSVMFELKDSENMPG